jgi:DNA-binding transcriptional MerR regulator
MGQVSVERIRHLDESVGFSVADIRPLQKRPHVDHANCMIALEPTFTVLASTHIGKGSLKAIATATRIPSGTVQDRRSHLLADPSWRPYQHRNEHRQALTDEQEAEVLQEIRVQCLDRRLSPPPEVAQIMVK